MAIIKLSSLLFIVHVSERKLAFCLYKLLLSSQMIFIKASCYGIYTKYHPVEKERQKIIKSNKETLLKYSTTLSKKIIQLFKLSYSTNKLRNFLI